MSYEALIEGVTAVIDSMRKDYAEFGLRGKFREFKSFEEAYAATESLYTIEEGRSYIKLIKDLGNGQRSVCGFIVKKESKKFQVGDMLKAAGWSAPATNFARGNVFNEEDTKNIRWTGIA